MTYPGVALMVMVGIGLGAFLYYMFSDNNNNNGHQYGNEGNYNPPAPESGDPWTPNQDARIRRRKRGSCTSVGKTSCTICLAELADKESIQLHPCKHEFHKTCINKWREQGPWEACNTCPNCREIFRSAM